MASDAALKGVNGYAPQQSYDQQAPTYGANSMSGSAVSGSLGAEPTNTASAGNTASSAAAEGNGSVPKDEVGWYFVEQYYTTLSKNPEKLHVSFPLRHFVAEHDLRLTICKLFYSKRSQFVSGVEAEKVSVSVGQRVSTRAGPFYSPLTNYL